MRSLIVGIVTMAVVALAAGLAMVQPKDVAAQLAAKGPHPVIVQVGPNLLFRTKHIPGAIFAGPGSKPEGLELLKKAVDSLPRDREVVLYCGCCPWENCPNVKPAVALLQQMGFTHVKAMFIETSFLRDWDEKHFPVESGQ